MTTIEKTDITTTRTVKDLKKSSEYIFRVIAENEMGESERSESEPVVIQAPVKAEPPIIKQPLHDVIIGVSKELKLECVISGTPPPEIKWFAIPKNFQL